MKNNYILVTGCCGFIGYHLCQKLVALNLNVVGIDNLNNYYSINYKKLRLSHLEQFNNFSYKKIDCKNNLKISEIFKKYNFTKVYHLAAQAGVRYSFENPKSYIENNIYGFYNILQAVKENNIKKFYFASSSSIYGDLSQQPFNEKQKTIFPSSLYGATKMSNELMSYSYSSLYGIKSIALRFFTVYGPWGRPDMSIIKFIHKIYNNKEIELFNYGNHARSFTYVNDIVNNIILLDSYKFKNDKILSKKVNFLAINIGNDKNTKLLNVVKSIEKILQKKAIVKYKPLQQGDVISSKSKSIYPIINSSKFTKIDDGLRFTIKWYLDNNDKLKNYL